MTTPTDRRRLILLIERGLLDYARLRALAEQAGVTLASHRQELRGLKTRSSRRKAATRKRKPAQR